ncbi:MAG: biopolymer transporter ExbD [Rhodobacteraceae bacterium]|nr:biopolymer transporter ExbD [Paracoccaceae bacterium]MAY45012.1 biopolymer transporter ExbD [Paracoccaceae bacterium]
MKLAQSLSKPKENTIALINVVFLMLVFFMIAGTLAPPLDPELSLIKAQDLEGRAPPDTLVIREDGTMWLRDVELTSASAFLDRVPGDDRSVVRIVPDRDLPALKLMAISDELRAGGAERVLLISERGLK